MIVHTDCAYFDGYKPCPPHKRSGVHCEGCTCYEPVAERILILKLGAGGEVVRCTPILRYLRQHHPNAELVWVTHFPDLVPEEWVARVLRPTWEAAEWLRVQTWSLVLSLDKDPLTCALAGQLQAELVKGFALDGGGRIAPADSDSRAKWLTGVFDDLMKANRKHYVQEIFEVCGWPYSGEKYILPAAHPAMLNPMPSGLPVVGLNTGAGSAWSTRLWSEANFSQLIGRLQDLDICAVLLGGPDEHDRNLRLARSSGAIYHGVKSLREYLNVVDCCDVVVTAVSLALHIAIGLQKRLVLLNNVFSRHEFHLFGLGEILEPGVPCLGCYKPKFDEHCPVANCMDELAVDAVLDAVQRQVRAGRPAVRAEVSGEPV